MRRRDARMREAITPSPVSRFSWSTIRRQQSTPPSVGCRARCATTTTTRLLRPSTGADIVALPSSDWRGIDPSHTEMATMRAIEQGLSIVRSTRFGLSAGIDPHGVMRAQRSTFETQGRILWIDRSPATRDSDRLSKDRRRVRCRLHDARRGRSALHRESKPGLFERPGHR